MILPTVGNCPECNGFYREYRPHKKPRFDQRPRGPIIRERGDDRRAPVHDRLGGRGCGVGGGGGEGVQRCSGSALEGGAHQQLGGGGREGERRERENGQEGGVGG